MTTVYNDDFPRQAYKLALFGATNAEMADFFEVEERTIDGWMNKHKEFRKQVKAGKLAADSEVAYKLFGRATGVSVTKQKVLSDGSVVDYKEELPADVRAAETWLMCRTKNNRAQWVPKNDVQVGGDKDNPLAFILGDIAKDAENQSPLPSKSDVNSD